MAEMRRFVSAALAAGQRRARADLRGSEGGEPNWRPRKIVHKTKRLERDERAMEIRAFALKRINSTAILAAAQIPIQAEFLVGTATAIRPADDSLSGLRCDAARTL